MAVATPPFRVTPFLDDDEKSDGHIVAYVHKARCGPMIAYDDFVEWARSGARERLRPDLRLGLLRLGRQASFRRTLKWALDQARGVAVSPNEYRVVAAQLPYKEEQRIIADFVRNWPSPTPDDMEPEP